MYELIISLENGKKRKKKEKKVLGTKLPLNISAAYYLVKK